MITGIGIDISEIERIRQAIDRFGDHFTTKIFTDDEIRYCRSSATPWRHFAARFAAKEALSKALATGNTGDFEWKNAEVISDTTGVHTFRLHNATEKRLEGCSVFLTLSYSTHSVVAAVIIENQERQDKHLKV
jgi:holo-[acyl-carrier protein] synthase